MKRPEGRAAFVCLMVVVFLLLPLLYVLSIGPAGLLWKHQLLSQDAYTGMYWPVIWLGHQSIWFGNFIAWYLNLFGVPL